MTESTVESSTETVLDAAKTERIRVLHIDDDLKFLSIAKKCLEMQDEIDVDTASSVNEASKKLKKTDYDAIVCDYQMPDKDGLEFLKELRADRNTIPFIVFTGKGREEVAIKALNLGADQYVDKTGDPETVYVELSHSIRKTVERKRAIKKVWEREQRLRATLASSPDAIIVSDLQGNIIDCNEAAWKLTDFSSKEELMGKNSFEFIAEKDRKRASENLKKTFEQGTLRNMEYTLLKKDGKEYEGDLSASVLKDSSGSPIGFVGVVRDITERRQIEKMLKHQRDVAITLSGTSDLNEAMNKLFDNLLEIEEFDCAGFYLVDEDTGEVDMIAYRGLPKGFVEKVSHFDASSPYTKIVMQGKPIYQKTSDFPPAIQKDLESDGILVVAAVPLQHKGAVIGHLNLASHTAIEVSAFTRNLLEAFSPLIREAIVRVKMESALRESEEKYRTQFEEARDAIFVADTETGRIFDCNHAVSELVGREKSELIGKHQRILHPPEEVEGEFSRTFKQHLEEREGQILEAQVITKEGEIKDVEIKANVFELDGKKLVQGIFRDITEHKKKEDMLRNSENKYRTLLENVPQKIFFKDRNSVYVSCNEKYARDLKIKSDDIVGKTDYDFYPKQLAEKYREDDKRIMESGQIEDIEEGYIQDGRSVWVHTVKTPVKDGNGRVVGVLGIFWDVTERKKAEEEREQLLHDYSDRVKELRCIYEIAKLVEKPNISLEELLRGTNDLLPAAWQYPDVTRSRIVFANQEFKTKNFKETKWKQQAIIQVNGKKTGVVEVYYLEEKPTIAEGPFLKEERDLINAVAERLGRIIERKKAEEALKKSEARFRCLVEDAFVSVAIADTKGQLTYVNQATVDMLGYSKSEMIGQPFAKFLHPDDKGKIVRLFLKSILLRMRPRIIEFRLVHKDGHVLNMMSKPTKFLVEGKTVGFQAISIDITEHRQQEEALRDANKKWTSLTKNTDDIVMIVDSNGIMQFINRTIPPYTPEETVGKKIYEYVPREQHIVLEKALSKVFKTGNPDEYQVSSNIPTIGTLWFNTKVVPIRDDGKVTGAILVSANITERKKMEKDLRDSEERLNILFERAPDAYYLNDLKGNLIDGNEVAEEITGYTRNELVGKSFLKLKLLSRSQTLKAAKLLAMNALGKATGPDEFALNRKDGTQVPVEIRTYPAKFKGETLVLGIARDISERKKLEEKLRVVGSLTRHDVRNKLSAVTGNAYLLKRRLSGDSQALEQLNNMGTAVRQIEQIFEFARTYEKLGVEQLTHINAGKTFDEAASLFSDLKGAKMVDECHGLTVLADSLLRQLFYNLIDNSLKYGEKTRRIRVHCKPLSTGQLELVYEDDGVGIPKNMRSNLFKEGVTSGKGTGYGLFMIKRICEVYGWTIQEKGTPSKGVRFIMTIPEKNNQGKPVYKLSNA